MKRKKEPELIPHPWLLNERKSKKKNPTFRKIMFQLFLVFFFTIFACTVFFLTFPGAYEKLTSHQSSVSSCSPVELDRDYVHESYIENETEKIPHATSNPDSLSHDITNSFEVRQKISDTMMECYYDGTWDGQTTKVNGHTVSLSPVFGSLLIDGSLACPSTITNSHCVDLPPEMSVDRFSEICFILGDGSYLIRDNKLVKYSHGKQVLLSDEELNWEGMNTEFYRPLDTFFFYDEPHDTLFIAASSVPYDLSNEELKYNVGIFLYVVPDRTKSEIEFVREVTNVAFDSDGVFYYYDTSGDLWRYSIIDDGLQFMRTFDYVPPAKGGIGAGIIQFNWWCTFADGYIRNTRAFPEGTFSKPVTTVPSVGLYDYEFSCKHLDKYNLKEED